MTRGLMVRTMSGFRFPGFIRISLSHLPIMEELVDSLKKILK